MKSVAAIIVTYNRKNLLCQCVESILKGTVVPDILVIDNHSSDGTAAAMVPYINCGDVQYFDTGENLGGAGGFNYGMRRAVESGYEYLWLMDDDTLPSETALEKFMLAAGDLNGKFGFLSSKVLWKDGSLCTMNVQRQTLTKNITDFSLHLIPAVMASFVSLFLRADTVQRVGLPIKEFFIWGDDIEYTRRIAVREKLPGYVVGQSQVIHVTKDNVGSNIAIDVQERLNRYNYAFRNENFLYRQEGFKGVCYYVAKCWKNILCSLLFAKDHRAKRCGIVAKQMIKGLYFNPKVEFVQESK